MHGDNLKRSFSVRLILIQIDRKTFLSLKENAHGINLVILYMVIYAM